MMMASQRAILIGFLMCPWHATAFWATLPRQTDRPGFLTMAPLSNEEIFARAQQQQQESDMPPPPPKIFDDQMLDDMQAALLLMEKRVQEGPLTILEVDQLSSQLHHIRTEMRANPDKKPPRPSPGNEATTTSASTDAPARGAGPNVIDIDTPADEGAEYDGRGGMGQAAGTKNTYIIPGMDEMTPEEYQQALEQTVIQRQRDRRYSGAATGNRSTWNYLNSLTGESGVLKKKE